MSRKIIVEIEGNIGAGKSTLIERLRHTMNAHVFSEPIEEWNDIKTPYKNVLEAQYIEPQVYSFQFQLYVCIVYVRSLLNQLEKTSCKYVIVERGLWAMRNVFIELYREKGSLTDNNITILDAQIEIFKKILSKYDRVVVYLDVSPTTCLERVIKRGREGEETITLELLTNLHSKYSRLLLTENVYTHKDVDSTVKYVTKAVKRGFFSCFK